MAAGTRRTKRRAEDNGQAAYKKSIYLPSEIFPVNFVSNFIDCVASLTLCHRSVSIQM